MKRPGPWSDDPLRFAFRQRIDNFFVDEIPLEEPTGKGGFLRVRLRKRGVSTIEVLEFFRVELGLGHRQIGYAGLKDKYATTTQYLSIPRRCGRELARLRHPRMEILEALPVRRPITMGDLAANRFRILLEPFPAREAEAFFARIERIAREGFANFFGMQRFGRDGRGWERGRDLLEGGGCIRSERDRIAVAAWQSLLFNRWLHARIRLARAVEKGEGAQALEALGLDRELEPILAAQETSWRFLPGECVRRVGGRGEIVADPLAAAEVFAERGLVPTGLLAGRRAPRAEGAARIVEARYEEEALWDRFGSRRDAWVWPRELKTKRSGEGVELRFVLPPGSYATVLLESLKGAPLEDSDISKPEGGTMKGRKSRSRRKG